MSPQTNLSLIDFTTSTAASPEDFMISLSDNPAMSEFTVPKMTTPNKEAATMAADLIVLFENSALKLAVII